jgi:uncharacterized membrane protein YqjE
MTLALIVAWMVHPMPREHAVSLLMLYLLVLALTMVAALGALFGACQFGTARAFAAGLKVGREIGSEKDPEPASGSHLRLVE